MKLRKHVPEFIVLVYAVLFLLTKSPADPWDKVIVSDGKGYYAYLTALFIYHDTDYGFIDKYESEYYPAGRQLYKDFRFDSGNGIINKYFPGPAILWLPFFAAGHTVAVLSGYPADGYSLPYQYAIAFAAFFYFWLALLILRRILRFYTKDENVVAWSLVAVALATNLVYYTVNAGSQVHVYNFFLVNGFIYSVLEACKRGKPLYYILAAFMLGMVIISRPQNGLIVFALPFICGSRATFILFFRKAFTEIRVLLLSALALAIPLLIPVVYWYVKTGHFLVYSYGSESYDLSKPHLFSFLFSFEKGWMLYTPIAAFAAFGFVSLFRKSKWQFFSLAAFLFFVVYFMSSWWIWTYTSYISQRVMIDFYAFIGILIVFIFNLQLKKQFVLKAVLSGLIALNVFQHFQQLIWVYPAGPVTANTYFGNFFSFSRGSTFMIPENEILEKQTYTTDFENHKTLFISNSFVSSSISHTGKKALILDSVSNGKQIFIRGMVDYRDKQNVILKIGGWFNPESIDSSLTLDVGIGTYKGKYSGMHHNLMPGLKAGKWKYAEMAVYLPYLRSVNDSLFISIQNRSKGKVLMDDLKVEFLKMQGPGHHDWILPADDQTESAMLYHTDFETPPAAPWGNMVSVSAQQSYSGKNASCIQLSSPYSVVFEKEMDFGIKSDGYLRVCSRVKGDTQSEVLLVFDFSSGGKQVYYKTYPIAFNGNSDIWKLSEIFREFPIDRLKAGKVKIYYWYIKGTTPVYIDDLQVDIVKYKPAKVTLFPAFVLNKNAETRYTTCCDFETPCKPESGFITEVPDAFSGKKVCLIDTRQPFSFSHLVPLTALKNNPDSFVYVTAIVNSDQYSTDVTLVADFRHKGKSVSYFPAYLRGQTIKGEWNNINFGVKVPGGITAQDSVLVYFYLPQTDEAMMIDDFCVSVKKKKNSE